MHMLRFVLMAVAMCFAADVSAAVVTYRDGEFSSDYREYYESNVVTAVQGRSYEYVFLFTGGLHVDFYGPAPSGYVIYSPGHDLNVVGVTTSCCPRDEEEGYDGTGTLSYFSRNGALLASIEVGGSLTSQKLSFKHSGGSYLVFSGNHASISDLVVTNVPEPASWAMMIVGAGAVGGSVRRRGRLQAQQA